MRQLFSVTVRLSIDTHVSRLSMKRSGPKGRMVGDVLLIEKVHQRETIGTLKQRFTPYLIWMIYIVQKVCWNHSKYQSSLSCLSICVTLPMTTATGEQICTGINRWR